MESNACGEEFRGQLLLECDDVEFLREQVTHLYGLLDDIDTASDVFKPCDRNEGSFKAYYEYALKTQARKNTKLVSDGHRLYLRKDG